MIHDTQRAQVLQKQDRRNIYAIMKTMCSSGYHHNGFVPANSCTWAHDLRLYIAGPNEPKIAQQVKQRA